jgi:hypothetical protein
MIANEPSRAYELGYAIGTAIGQAPGIVWGAAILVLFVVFVWWRRTR